VFRFLANQPPYDCYCLKYNQFAYATTTARLDPPSTSLPQSKKSSLSSIQPTLRLGSAEMTRDEWTIIFVLGGPGVGKGTQCKKLTEEYQICHLSVGDVLRAETTKAGSEYAEIILGNMREGRVGPPQITVSLLEAAMREKFEKEGVSIFLIDGNKFDHSYFPNTFLLPSVCYTPN
jgi:hypothetical protein